MKALASAPIGEMLFCGYALVIFLNEWVRGFMLGFIPDVFDDSIKIVSGLYAKQGFVPYTDYGIVYPPGLLMLSRILNLDGVSRFQVFAFIYLVIASCIVAYVARRSRSWVLSGAVLVLLTVSSNVSEDLLLEGAWYLLIFATLWYLERGRRVGLILISLCVAVVALLKWERPLIFVGFSALGWISMHRVDTKTARRFVNLLMAVFGGICSALIAGVTYLIASGTHLADAYHFIITVPLKILPFRRLPLPDLFSSQGSIWMLGYAVYFAIAMLIIATVVMIMRVLRSSQYQYLILLCIPVGLLPYASGRADSVHAFPLLGTLTAVMIIMSLVTRRAIPILIACVVYLAANFGLFTISPLGFLRLPVSYIDLVDASLVDCRNATKDISYQTLFIGRSEYTEYVYNHVMLYLLNPRVKPATRYISDEPGLQSDCVDGEAVTQDLTRAGKPTLALLETQPQKTEANLSSSLVSCGYIERWLRDSAHDTIGTCEHLGKPFEIRLYR